MQQQLTSSVPESSENSPWNMHCVIFDTNPTLLFDLQLCSLKSTNKNMQPCKRTFCSAGMGIHVFLCSVSCINCSAVSKFQAITAMYICIYLIYQPCCSSALFKSHFHVTRGGSHYFFSICKICNVQIKSFLNYKLITN